MKKIIAASVCILILLCVFKLPSFAISYGGIGISPANPDPNNSLTESWFIYNLVPGEKKSDAFILNNTSENQLSANLYPVDGTTTKDGAFALLTEKDKNDVGGWVQLSEESVTLGPGEQKVIPFTIAVPKNVNVGDHVGGIIVENTDVSKGKGVNIVTRVGVRIYQTVPGKLIRKLSLTNFSWGWQDKVFSFYFELKNEGNVRIEPKGKLVIKDAISNAKVADYDIDLRMVLPGKDTKVPIVWKTFWPFGKALASVAIVYGDKPSERIEQEVSFWYLNQRLKPVFIIVGFLLMLLLLKSLILSKRR